MKQAQRFSEIEYCLQKYFNTHFAPVMQDVRNFLSNKQVDELEKYHTSFAGIMSSLASSPYGTLNDSYDSLRLTGKWNSKTDEDYVKMCSDRIAKNKDFQKDLLLLSSEWRNAMVAEIGRTRYDQISQQLGGDLAFAYIDYRVEQMMIDKMAKDRMPTSTMEYIVRKGAENSFIGLGRALTRSPLEEEIDNRGERAYNPSKKEKITSRGMSLATDVMTFGGISSWSTLVRVAGAEAVFAGIEQRMANNAKKNKPMTVEECISQGVFGDKSNVFNSFHQRANAIVPYENSYVKSINAKLTKKMGITTGNSYFSSASNQQTHNPFISNGLFSVKSSTQERDPRYKDVPMVVMPGHEEEYLATQKRLEAEKEEAKRGTQEAAITEQKEENKKGPKDNNDKQEAAVDEETSGKTNDNGWESLISSVGLNGFGDITRNLGYVIAMLPDLLFGMFTGKTHLRIKDNLMPIASILLGLFVKNPLLKMVLVGMGGANLLNKAGHEALAKAEGRTPQDTVHGMVLPSQRRVQYKQYSDEPLNPRIQNPVLQGHNLIATIDHVPYSISLPNSVIGAYEAGALPINTLANAILAKNDQFQSMNNVARENYEKTQEENNIIQRK